MATRLEQVEKGRQCIERIFNRIATNQGVAVQSLGWDDKKRNQPDPMTSYLFTFGIGGEPKSIEFCRRELDDCEIDEDTRRQIEHKIHRSITPM